MRGGKEIKIERVGGEREGEERERGRGERERDG